MYDERETRAAVWECRECSYEFTDNIYCSCTVPRELTRVNLIKNCTRKVY